jgi:biopolymer transport protein ExbD
MRIPSPRAGKKARIEIVPLIDIIFFLLATFVMVSLSMVKHQGIPVNLPVAATSTPDERKDYVAITLSETGELYFNKERIAASDLDGRLDQLKASTPTPKIFLNGDKKAEFGLAVEVLDKVRSKGIAQVAIETKPVSRATPQ